MNTARMMFLCKTIIANSEKYNPPAIKPTKPGMIALGTGESFMSITSIVKSETMIGEGKI